METLAFAHVNHNVLVPGVYERLLVRFCDVKLTDLCPSNGSPTSNGCPMDIRCNVYAGPASAAKVQSARKEVEVVKGAGQAFLDVGLLNMAEPWVVRIKFFGRNATKLFRQNCLAEAVLVAPCTARSVTLRSQDARGEEVIVGSLSLEIHRVLPESAMKPLVVEVCRMLKGSGLENFQQQSLSAAARELVLVCGGELVGSDAGTQLLEVVAGLGCDAEVESLLNAGVLATAAAVRAADNAGFPLIAHKILYRTNMVPNNCDDRASMELQWCLQQNLPRLADWIHSKSPKAIDSLVNKEVSVAKTAYEAQAWGVLLGLVDRGGALPVPAVQMLDSALTAGHVPLARACLPRFENVADIESALGACLGQKLEQHLIRETLETHWKLRSKDLGASTLEGPTVLMLQRASEDELVECPVCFEPLCKAGAAALLNESNCRACPHFICQACATNVQDEVDNRCIIQDRDTLCPLCRTTFTACARLPDPTVDPCAFFRLACLPDAPEDEQPKLSDKVAFETLCAILPVNPSSFKQAFNDVLWPAWTHAAGDDKRLSQEDFTEPCGMLAWLSDHILELKVDRELGPPPNLASESVAWFEHFDYNADGLLAKGEVLRGIAKTMKMSELSAMACGKDASTLQNLIDSLWDDSLWPNGVSRDEFVAPGGLSQKILSALPQSCTENAEPIQSRSGSRSVEQALKSARLSDLQESASYKTRLSPAMVPQVFAEIDLSGALDEMSDMLRYAEGQQRRPSVESSQPESMGSFDDDTPCEQPRVSHPRVSLVRNLNLKSLQAVANSTGTIQDCSEIVCYEGVGQYQQLPKLLHDSILIDLDTEGRPQVSRIPFFKTRRSFTCGDGQEWNKRQVIPNGDTSNPVLIDLDSDGSAWGLEEQETMLITM